MSEIENLDTAGNKRLAYSRRRGRGPAIIFLPGYMSDMSGSKATALDRWAADQGRLMVRFDYGGCGLSSGDFEHQTLHGWLDNTLTIIDRVAEGPVILVGSSMGGWLMLHAALARPDRVKGLVGIAAAPDFTDWGYSDDEKRLIGLEGKLVQASPYGDVPYITTRAFWESGQALRLMQSPLEIECPVRLLHGQADEDVPWTESLALMANLRSADVQATFIKDGDHRLSRDQDIKLLIATISSLLEVL